MMIERRRGLRFMAAALGTAVIGGTAARAQVYPSRPIRLVVGYAAGGGADAVARLVATRLSAVLGQQVVVENRGGAAGLIAAEQVAGSAADGYTLLLGETSMLIAPHMKTLSFDPLTSFAPIANVFILPQVIVVNNDFPAATPAAFVARLKAEPGRYSYATSGAGGIQHLGFELLKTQTGTSAEHIPYRGASQIIPDVISGRVPIGVMSAAAALAQVKGGRLRAMAIMSPARLAGAEAIPPLADVLPGFDATPRLFVVAPAGTPATIVAHLGDAIQSVMATPDLAGLAAAQGAVPAYANASVLAAEMPRESQKWAPSPGNTRSRPIKSCRRAQALGQKRRPIVQSVRQWGRETLPVGRLDFKSSKGRWTVLRGFDSHSLPPLAGRCPRAGGSAIVRDHPVPHIEGNGGSIWRTIARRTKPSRR